MKNLFLLLSIALLCFGCSKKEESQEAASERVGKDIANRMQAPIEKTKSVTDQIGNIRATENELTQ